MKSRLDWMLAAALSVVSVLAVCEVDYLPTNDGPQHLFGSHASRRLDDESTGYGQFFERGTPTTALGFDAIFAPLEAVTSWQTAYRVSLAIMVLLWTWGAFFFLGSLAPGRPIGFFAFALGLSWPLYMGLFPFFVSTGVGFWLLALAIRRRPWTRGLWAILSVGLLCQSVLHVFPTFLVGITLTAIAISEAKPQARIAALAKMMLCGVPAAFIAWLSMRTPDVVGLAPMKWAVPINWRLSQPAWAFLSGPDWRAWPPVFACFAGGLSVLIGWRRRTPVERALTAVGLLFLLATWLLPMHVVGWEFFSVRFAPMAVVLLIALLPIERFGITGKRLFSVLVLGFVVASQLWAWQYARNLRKSGDDMLAGLVRSERRTGSLLPILLDDHGPMLAESPIEREIPFSAPFRNLGALYAVAQGGTPIYVFQGRLDIHLLHARRPPTHRVGRFLSASEADSAREYARDPARRASVIDRLLSFGALHDEILFNGRASDLAQLKDRGFELTSTHGGFTIARFRGCTLHLEVRGREQEPVLAQVAWSREVGPFRQAVLPPSPNRTTALEGAPCGQALLRAAVDLDHDSRATAKDLYCTGADDSGVLTVEVSDQPVICHLAD